MKVAIVGSRRYVNKTKIKDSIFELKERFGDELEIVSGGCPYGADMYAKKYALEFGIKYVEFPPRHANPTVYCPEPSFLYGQSYSLKYFFIRNQQVANYCDVLIAFIPTGVDSKGTEHTIKCVKKLNKPYGIIN